MLLPVVVYLNVPHEYCAVAVAGPHVNAGGAFGDAPNRLVVVVQFGAPHHVLRVPSTPTPTPSPPPPCCVHPSRPAHIPVTPTTPPPPPTTTHREKSGTVVDERLHQSVDLRRQHEILDRLCTLLRVCVCGVCVCECCNTPSIVDWGPPSC